MIYVEMLPVDRVSEYKIEIIELIKETLISNFPNNIVPTNYYEDTFESLLNHVNDGNAFVFAAFENEEILGWMWCHPINRFDSKRMHIANFAVKQEFQKRGIGHMLMEFVEKYTFHNNFDSLDLLVTKENISAVKFYEKHDFEVERYLMRKVDKNDYKNS